ncbi:MAG: pyridoxal-phosphate dependent enzyme [Deinococcus sp.]|nr:pyridoxal-phosphate dependent enzyme [Deinococcus sp.]
MRLLAAYPELAAHLPWLPLGTFPTPVEPVIDLGEALGCQLWIKRDDRSGPLYGGNKVRLLEFLLAEAQRRQSQTLLLAGSLGSNFVLATAIYAQTLRPPPAVRAVLFPRPFSPDLPRKLALCQHFGAQLHLVPALALLPPALLWHWLRSPRPLLLPPGGAAPLPCLGYVDAALELAQQVALGQLPEPHYLFVPLGSGGTAAGLLAGLRLSGLHTHVVAVRISSGLIANAARVARLANQTLALLAHYIPRLAVKPLTPHNLIVLPQFLGKGYGAPTPEAQTALALAKERGHLELDSTYTAKTLAGLAWYVQRHQLQEHPILFWHTLNTVPLPQVTPLPSTVERFLARHRPGAGQALSERSMSERAAGARVWTANEGPWPVAGPTLPRAAGAAELPAHLPWPGPALDS